MINFSDEQPSLRSEPDQAKTNRDASAIAQRRLLAREAVRVAERLALAYVLSNHFERETVDLLHPDVREAVFCLLELVEYLDSQAREGGE